MDSATLWSLLAAAGLLLGNAFFVGAEFSLISARRSSIEPKARAGNRRAKRALWAMEHVSFLLAGAQLGITLCSLGLGALGEPLIAHLLEGPFHAWHVPEALIHPLSFAIALSIMTYLHVVVGEVVPKNLALTDPDRSALWLATPMGLVIRLLYPFVVGLNAAANWILRRAGIRPREEVTSSFTRDEVAGFVEESHREGLISSDEEQLLAGALRFDEDTVAAIMVPRDQLVTISPKTTPEEFEQLVTATGFSRFPVRNRSGRLTGYLHLKDLLHTDKSARHHPIDPHLIRPMSTIAATASLRTVLSDMQRSGNHLATVIARSGQVRGVVTLEDVLEKLVGEISDVRSA